MATATKKTEDTGVDFSGLNVFQKLQMARIEFLKSGVKKSGKNMHLEFMYFELEDIVPIAENIFFKVGLLGVPTFGKDYAVMRVFNCDDRNEDPVVFEAPFSQIAPIISNTGKVVTNEMQALGSSITYMRRYLWQLVLDIIEADGIDPNIGLNDDTPAQPEPPKQKKPVSAEKRQEIKKELTDPSIKADELQIKALKTALKNLMELDSDQESFVQSIAVKTEGFTNMSKEVCEQLINGVAEMVAAYSAPAQEG